MTLEKLDTLETLVRARNLLARDGWVQGTYAVQEADGITCKRCAYGALENWSTVTDFHDDLGNYSIRMHVHPDPHALGLLSDAMYEIHDPKDEHSLSRGIANWNDTVGRTEEQVLQAFDLAIEKARSER